MKKINHNLNQFKKNLTEILHEWNKQREIKQYIAYQLNIFLHFQIWLEEYQSKLSCFYIIQSFTLYITHSVTTSVRPHNFQ